MQDLKLSTTIDARIARELDAQGRVFKKRAVLEAALLAFMSLPIDDRLAAMNALNAWKTDPNATITEDHEDDDDGTSDHRTAGSRRTASVR